MILNERQYRITRAAEARIAKEVEALMNVPTRDLSPRQHALLLKAGQGQLQDLRREVEEYEALRRGATPIAPIGAIEELPLALIRARIARGWTQAELAEELGVAEQQVQRDEANVYRGASIERLRRVGDALRFRLRGALEPTYARRDGRSSRSMIRDAKSRITLKRKTK